MFYAYIHARPGTRTARGIFHVGKGKGNRMYNFSNSRNVDYKREVAGLDKPKILIGFMECSTEGIAFDLEKGLIKRLRAMGAPLTNETGGGIGALEPSEKLRTKLQSNWDDFGAKAAIRNRERVWTPEMRAVQAADAKKAMEGMSFITNGTKEERFPKSGKPPRGWRFGRLPKSEETKAKIGTFMLGNSYTRGKRHITNGIKNAMVDSGETPPAGWWFGHTKRRR